MPPRFLEGQHVLFVMIVSQYPMAAEPVKQARHAQGARVYAVYPRGRLRKPQVIPFEQVMGLHQQEERQLIVHVDISGSESR